MSDEAEAEELIALVEGRVGRLRLNRPRPIHALTLDMCRRMSAALDCWSDDPAIELVLLDHAQGRGFCAGGDVRAAAESGKGDGVYARSFFRDEYQLNHQMFTYPKPIVVVMDGITMGGGAGIADPATYRVVTERTVYAMPETGIGLFPDVGGGWYLSRLPGRVGVFLGLTGARLDGAECLALGIATHYLPSDAIEALKAAIIARPAEVEAILGDASVVPPSARILDNRERIDRLFAADRLEDILAALEADGSEWAAKERATLATKSPQAMKVTLRLIAEARGKTDFADEMAQEYAMASRICRRHDFIEGIRALLVDKDNQPRWDPPTADAVSDQLIDEIMAPLPAGECWTPYTRNTGA
jgi:enoyl-CoA hydratase